MTALIGLLLAPFALTILLVMIRPLVMWIDRSMPDSRAKRVLFFYWKN